MFKGASLSAFTIGAVVAAAATIDVQVGGSGLIFTPDHVNASQGDVIQFHINSGHAVTQSQDFSDPCSALETGFQSVDPASLNITVNGTDPVWVHCPVGQHCKMGMVFAINAASSGNQTFNNFQALAEGRSPSSSNGTSSSSPASSGTPSPTSSATGTASSAPAASHSAAASLRAEMTWGTGLLAGLALAFVSTA